VLNDVLDFSKIEAGKLALEALPFDLDGAVRQTVKAFGVRARDRGIDLDVEFASDVPWAVVGDAGRLRQVLVNLLDNAVRFTQNGRVHVLVEVDDREDDEITLQFTVQDSGIGIPQEQHASIFESFTQADGSTTRRYGGTGLGLTISARLVAMMGGRIQLESESGEGSTFRFTARFGLSHEGEKHLRDVDAALAAAGRLPRLKVLVAEDNLVNRTLIARILQKHGHEVIEARDGEEALRAIDAGGVDLVLMDLEMPRVGGIEATRRIRERERGGDARLPVVALTAHALHGDRERCLTAGMDGYVPKPIRRSELFASMAAALPVARLLPPGTERPGAVPHKPTGERLSEMFVRACRSELQQMREAVARDDLEAVRRLAHGMAGSASVVGALEIMQLSREVASSALARETSRVMTLCEEITIRVDAYRTE
jgi:CheY-like chemotaxis protein